MAFSAAANPNDERAHRDAHDRGPDVHASTRRPRRAPTRCCRRASRSSRVAARGSTTCDDAWPGVRGRASATHGWLTVTSGASGSGTGTVAFSAAANPRRAARTGTITIAGQTFTVNQAAAACTYTLQPTSQSVVAGGGTRVDDGDGAGRVCVDGREQQHVVVDGDERGERQRDRHRGVQRGGQSDDERRAPGRSRSRARRSPSTRRPRLHLRAAADEPIGRRGGRHAGRRR